MSRFVFVLTAGALIGAAIALAVVLGLPQFDRMAHGWHMLAGSAAVVLVVSIVIARRIFTRTTAALCREVEENRRLTSLLQQSEEAEKRFWSGVSHDLRTPLNSILGYAELMLEEMPDETPATFKTDLERIKNAGFDLLVRINELLTVSELQVGTQAPHLESTDISSLLNDVAEVLTPLAGRQSTRLDVEVPQPALFVKTDAIRLERILLALATNSVKYTDEGTISLSANYDGEQGELELVVSDTGTGISEEDLNRIFQPYSSGQAVLHSSGLALSASKQLVEEMGGSIDVTSAPGSGTTCSIRIPAEEDHAPNAEGSGELYGLSSPPNVLIIDEDEDAADLLSRHLRRFGCHVTISVDGAFGKDLAVDLQPDLVIMEVEMTSIDGWAVLQHLKYDSRTRDIPVVVSSSRDMRGRAREMGAEDYLIKPITASTAFNGLAHVTSMRQRLSRDNSENLETG